MVFTSVDNSDEEVKLVKSILRKRSDLIQKSSSGPKKVKFNLDGKSSQVNRDLSFLRRCYFY